jgi:sugar O-acyltransferase (sialic acid O-acetyltransferase NeuD family)
MSGLLIIGAGGHGLVVADAALSGQRWQRIAFVDDRGAGMGRPLDLEVLGTVAELGRLGVEFAAAAVGIGDAHKRLELLSHCERLGFSLPVVVHRSAAVSPFAQLGSGCVVLAQAAVSPHARLGMGCIVNTGASVDHDCSLAEGVHVCPGAHLAGNVRVGARSWIGIGACVREGIEIGADVVVGAGAAVVASVRDATVAVGVPARVLR